MKSMHVAVLLLMTLRTGHSFGQLPALAEGNWPQFRGVNASGNAKSGNPPLRWDAESGANVRWKLPIPGLGHSSPVVWGDRLFLTTAAGQDGQEPYLRVGLYGESPDHPEDFTHDYDLYCIDKKSGKVKWKKTARSGVPQIQRHIKSSHATSTPATDGKHVVVFFGSEGLYCYDMKGRLLWEKDLGYLDAGAFDVPEIQWGFGSSPVIHRDRVIVLCDVNNQSFIAAYDVESGRELWKTLRDEVPTWGTPTIVEVNGRTQAVVNGWHRRAAYDVETGEEIWWMDGGGDIPIPTPVTAHGLIFFGSAHGRHRPIYAVRTEAEGNITLQPDETASAYVAYTLRRRAGYVPTPLVYGDFLYVLNNNGIFTCYDARTGRQIFRERAAGQRGSYSASPVVAGGKIYVSSEYGDIHVFDAGPEYKHLATNTMGEICMATPAFSGDLMFIRTHKALYAVENRGDTVPEKKTEPTETDAAEAVPKMPDLPAGEMSDPTEILKITDAAAKAVQTVRYEISLDATDALKPYVGSGRAAVAATGHIDGLPSRFVSEVTFTPFNSTESVEFMSMTDGKKYYFIHHAQKKVHEDIDHGVFGPYRQVALGTLFTEFFVPDPFGQEVNGRERRLDGSETIGGEPCYKIHVVYDNEQGSEVDWYISKKDFLPRRRVDYYTLPNGQKGTVIQTITGLDVNPELEADLFTLKMPEGYTRTFEAVE